MNTQHQSSQQQLLLTVVDAAAVLAIGRTTFYGLIDRGEIKTVRIGKSRRVPWAALEEYVEQQRSGVA